MLRQPVGAGDFKDLRGKIEIARVGVGQQSVHNIAKHVDVMLYQPTAERPAWPLVRRAGRPMGWSLASPIAHARPREKNAGRQNKCIDRANTSV